MNSRCAARRLFWEHLCNICNTGSIGLHTAMARLTYTGCVYADPAHDASQAGPRDLTKDELQAMRLAGLPVRIEHGSRALAGTVRASKTDPESGYTTVELELDDAVAGHAAAELIDRGVIAQLSLRHDV